MVTHGKSVSQVVVIQVIFIVYFVAENGNVVNVVLIDVETIFEEEQVGRNYCLVNCEVKVVVFAGMVISTNVKHDYEIMQTIIELSNIMVVVNFIEVVDYFHCLIVSNVGIEMDELGNYFKMHQKDFLIV